MQFDLYVKPGGYVTVEHIHARQSERFDILSGTLDYRVGSEPEQQARPGQSFVVPNPPIPLQCLLSTIVAPLALLTGLRDYYPEYTDTAVGREGVRRLPHSPPAPLSISVPTEMERGGAARFVAEAFGPSHPLSILRG